MTTPSAADGGIEVNGTAPMTAEHTGVALLAAKLAPPDLAHATVPRPRLLGLVSRAVQRSALTLLSGPAGSGKTVLAASWRRAQAAGAAVAWLTLDEYDDDPATFWAYAVEALSGAGADLPDLPGLFAGEPPPGWFVPRLAADLAARPRPVVLIVDNADHVTSRSIVGGLDFLVRQAGGRLRLVLCARADPPLPLHLYRLAGTMSEIRCDQLAFTPEETRDLLGAMGVPVSPEVARALCGEAEGWAVGLRLAAAPLKRGVAAEQLVTSLAHDDGSVAQYLFAEVLQQQPASVRRLLLRISVTAELWPDLVDRLGGRRHGSRVVAALAHANAFVEQSPGAPGGHRIHPLFREMLQAQLGYDLPHEVAGLHRTCAAWLEQAGRAPDAVGHAIAAEDWALVTRLLIDDLLVGRLLAHGTDPALRGLDALPDDLAGPEAAVIRAAVALSSGREPAPSDLAASAAAGADPAHRLSLRASAALVCVAAGALSDRPGSAAGQADAADALLSALPEGHRRELHESLAVLATARAVAAVSGDAPTGDILTVLRAATAASQAAGARRLRCYGLASTALLAALDGHLTRALQCAREAEETCAEDGRSEGERSPAAATALAWVCAERYDVGAAHDWAGRARRRARASALEATCTAALLAVVHSRLLRLRHEHDKAEQWLRPHLDGPRLPRWVHERVVTEAVRLSFARGRTDEGLAVLDGLGDTEWGARLRATAALLGGGDRAGTPAVDARGPGPPAVTVEAGIIRGCQLLDAGNATAAAAELERALQTARPELLRRPFLDAPPQARRLLRVHPRLRGPGAWLDPSSADARSRARPARAEPPPVTQDLSDRELEVLRHLAEMLSTAEIAATMFISVNTVRTHVRSILRKLSVGRRNQAVRRARELGII